MAGLLGQKGGQFLGLGEAIFGGIQAYRANKLMNRLLSTRPQYNISQGYLDALHNYQNLASGNMPGYEQAVGQIGQGTAKAYTAAERGAMGSNQYMDAVLQAQDKEMEAVRGLGMASAQWRTQQRQNVAGQQNLIGQQQDVMFQTNQLDPWNMRMNMAAENKQAGMGNLFSGLGTALGSASNYAGTQYYQQVLDSLFSKGGGGSVVGGQGGGSSLAGGQSGGGTTGGDWVSGVAGMLASLFKK